MSTSWTCHLDGLRVGREFVDFQKIIPSQRRNLEQRISKIILANQQIFSSKEPTKLSLLIDRGCVVMQSGSKKIEVRDAQAKSFIKRLRRTQDYLRHFSELPKRDKDASQELDRARGTHESIKRTLAKPSTTMKIVGAISPTIDALSFSRNVLRTIPSVGPGNFCVNNSGYIIGIFGAIMGGWGYKQGKQDYVDAEKISDAEGMRRADGKLWSAGLTLAGSSAFIGEKVLETVGTGGAVIAGGFASGFLFGAGALLGIGLTGLGIYRCRTFAKRFDEYLEKPGQTEEERLRAGVEYLRDLVIVTDREKLDILKEADEEAKSPAEKKHLIQQKMVNLTELKLKYLKRRTSMKSLHLILNHSEEILTLLSSDSAQDRAKGVEKAQKLVGTIKEQNNRKQWAFALSMAACIFGLAAIIAGFILSGGTLPFILAALSAATWLVITLYGIAVSKFTKDPDPINAGLPPLIGIDGGHN